jgi:hypothetical protein
MLFIEIQEGKARMAKKEPVEWITLLGQAVATTLRLIVNWANTGRIVIGDSWFGSFKCLVALHAYVGFYAILIVKQAHRAFPLQHLKDWGKTITRADRGSHKVLETTYKLQKQGQPHLPADAPTFKAFALGWADKKTKTILFNHGTTEPAGSLQRHRSKIVAKPDGTGFKTEKYDINVKTCDVVRTLFLYFPKIDIHDHYRQGSLRFHENWPTKTWWHRFYSNILGMIISDAYFMYIAEWKKYTNEDKSIAEPYDYSSFIDRLSYDMVHYHVILRDRAQHARRASIGGAAAAVPVVDEVVIQRKPVSICNWRFYRFNNILFNSIHIRCGRLISPRN